MSNLTKQDINIMPVMSEEHLALATKAEEVVRTFHKTLCCTQHTLHAGMYSRTLFIPKGTTVVGVIIKVPTTLVINGNLNVFLGGSVKNYDGYHVVAAPANRKQVVHAMEDSYVTLSFPTNAKTIEDAERDMTDESHRLQSREKESFNLINITGE